ncbi:hypothetical protein OSB04_025562 [Centaurea solstitialis]|uniref:Uncharacterized protein n=1 Tax=Centaurea solstitialis TaxID=347529 RepID=A0AA38WBE5_9ASTR|nr:hypothetical protein OSB04_025562 [Centaurea solstitialis]
MKFFIVLLILTPIFVSPTKGIELDWDGKKYCSNMVCKMGIGDQFCIEDCTPRGWTHGQCLQIPGTPGDSGYCCCWTP